MGRSAKGVLGVACIVTMGALAGCGGDSVSTGSTIQSVESSISTGGRQTAGSGVTAVISSVSPASVDAGVAFTLDVHGSNFQPSSYIELNGAVITTTLVSATELQALVPDTQLIIPGNVSVQVINPGPEGTASVPGTITLTSPSLQLISVSPTNMSPGSAAFTLDLHGVDFNPQSVIDWNGVPLSTSYVSSTELKALVPAADVTDIGSGLISVTGSPVWSYTSNLLAVAIGYQLSQLQQSASDIVWDGVNEKLYLTVPSNALTNANSVLAYDPSTGTVSATVVTGGDPDRIVISDDSQFAYVGLDKPVGSDGEVERLKLPTLTTDISIDIGHAIVGNVPYYALDMAVEPGAPHTLAVARGDAASSPTGEGSVLVYDDATARANTFETFTQIVDTIQWDGVSGTLYGGNNETSYFDFYVFSVDSTGISIADDYKNTIGNFGTNLHLDSGTGIIYSDDGQAIDPATARPVGLFDDCCTMVPDSSLSRAYFVELVGEPQQGVYDVYITSFDLTHFTPVNTIVALNISGTPKRLIRWGTDGLAFVTTNGVVYLLSGSFVTE